MEFFRVISQQELPNSGEILFVPITYRLLKASGKEQPVTDPDRELTSRYKNSRKAIPGNDQLVTNSNIACHECQGNTS